MTQNYVRFAIVIGLLVALGAASAVTPAWLQSSQEADRFSPVRELIRTRMADEGIPSVAVSVAQQGKIIWEEGFGFADLANQVRATPHTVYRISSVSKVFTGTAIMILIEQGKMELDRPMNEYLGEAKLRARVGSAEQATIRRLANHTSGLPAHDQYFYDGEAYKKTPADEMETLIARYGNIVWVPGERTEYSNLAMGVLSYVVSRQSGMSFGDFMHKEVYGPLGMKRSFVGLSDELRQVAAVPYLEGKPVPLVTNSTVGAGDLWGSAHDLVRFGMLHLNTLLPDQQAILGDESLQLLRQPAGSEYGIGWGTDSNYRGTGYSAVGHHGGNIGWHSFLVLIPSEKLAVAVLTNGSSHNFADLVSDSIMGILVPDFEERRVAAVAKRKAQQKAAAKPRSQTPSAREQLVGEWHGTIHTYEGPIAASFEFEQAGSAYAQIGEQPKTELTRLSFKKDTVTADLKATILTGDTRRQLPEILEVDLTLRGDELNGVIYANSLFGNPAWGGYRLGHWIELKRR